MTARRTPSLLPLLLVGAAFLTVALGKDSHTRVARNTQLRAGAGVENSEQVLTLCQSCHTTPRKTDELDPTLTCTAQCPLCPPCPSAPKCPTPCSACPSCPRIIPPGYEHFPGLGYYRLHVVPVDWMTAKETCEREGAHLVVINSQAEADLMVKLFQRYPSSGPWLFIGFHDLFQEGKYITVLGQPLEETGYYTWNPHQPDNNEKNENCGSIYPSGGLNDLNCSFKELFVCELPV